ncbi:type II toxin-antitoxin system Phd/YefM family antitoxin [Demequina aurantiaca]|uniref:type II toxin-antitoxin system Phd/YefM family antitoxin n=1 Tax=Demequina aurantiaca TaxID=676200 RepID=UPI003D32676A
MDITVDELSSGLGAALTSARAGKDVVITEDGVPVARLTGVEGATLLAKLAGEGLISPPAEDRAVPRLPQAEAAKDALSSLLGRLRR